MKKYIKFFLKPSIVLVGLIITYFVLFTTNGVPFIYSDGFGSFHTTQCLIKEHSFACSENPTYYPKHSYHTVSYYKDRYVTVYAPGSAILQLPGQILANQFSSDNDYSEYFTAANGHTILQGSAFLITSILLSIFSFFAIYKTLRNLGFNKYISTFSLIITYGSSYAIWYVFLQSGFNHTTEILGLSLQILGLSYIYINKNKKGVLWCAIGTGLAVLARPPLVLSGILIGLYLLYKKLWKESAIYIITGLPFAIIYLIYNKISYDKFFTSSYKLLFNQDFVFDDWNVLELLFSPLRGWFTYSPLFLLSILGLLITFKIKKFRGIALISLISILFTASLYGFWPMWWGGGSYGQRFMISFIPFLVLGTAVLVREIINLEVKNTNFSKAQLKYFQNSILIGMLILTTFSITTTLLYRITPVASLRPRTENIDGISSGDRYRIWDIYKYHLDLINNSNSPKNYLSDVGSNVTGGHSYLSLGFGLSKHVLDIDYSNPKSFKLVYVLNPTRDALPPSKLEYIIHDTNTGEFKEYTSNIQQEIIFNCNIECIPNSYLNVQNLPADLKVNNVDYGGFWLNQNTQIFIKYNDDLYYKGKLIRVEPGVNFYN